MHHDPDEVITYLEIGPPIICHVVALIYHSQSVGRDISHHFHFDIGHSFFITLAHFRHFSSL